MRAWWRTARSRHKAERLGRWGEWLAGVWMRLKGWRILARRVRTPVGEIDLIVRRGRTLAIVEVKVRRDLADAAEALRRMQKRRIARAAACWLAAHPHLAALDIRFDLIAIGRFGRLRHLADAFRAEEVLPAGAIPP